GQRFYRHAERRALLDDVVVQLAVGRMEINRGARLALDLRDTHDVIQMRVSDPDRHRTGAGGTELIGDEARLLARIDDGAFGRRFVHHEVGVLDELAVRDRHHLHDATPAFSFCSRSVARYFSTAIAAVVASPTAVVICRVSWLRTSPAANSPGIEVIIRSSVMKYPPASCLACPSTRPALGLKPTKMNTPPTARVTRPPAAVSSRTR